VLLTDFQPLAAIATTPQAIEQLLPLCQAESIDLWVPDDLATQAGLISYGSSLKQQLPILWSRYRGLMFGLATGAVVRLIAPFLADKATDPAVVVLAETGGHLISLCGGHQGGGDRLTLTLAALLGVQPILTGAAQAKSLVGIDILGTPFGWQRGQGDWLGVSAAIARGERVEVLQDAGATLWQQHLPDTHPFYFQNQDDFSSPTISPKARVWISPSQRRLDAANGIPKVQWHPRVLWLGMGCERGTSLPVLEAAVAQALQAQHYAEAAVAGVATLDLKADEAALIELCQARGWPIRLFAPEVLAQVVVPNPSATVAAEVGTPSVAEAAALLAATPPDPSPEQIAQPQLRLSKQIIRLPDQPGAATIAIAEAPREYTGRLGQLWLVGTGPGQLAQITPAAQAAITQADAVIGYSLYMELLQPLFRPGQILEALPITQERQRAQRAIHLAEWGLTVAVVSSGDAGIYGMAGLVLEELQTLGWDGQTPTVEVFPGVTALQAAAARVGTPLMHDFCAISLSDLLTPWQLIIKRLTAAAQADFVTALYNPRSQSRDSQLGQAQAIFLEHRAPTTPVALVRSAYRPEETITLTTLAELPVEQVDMLTVVLIGNQSTRFYAGRMMTPRGYLGFGNVTNCV
jgi:cobalt-precorrin 5A hydrolase / precorrin-3B C17-methyltransferase